MARGNARGAHGGGGGGGGGRAGAPHAPPPPASAASDASAIVPAPSALAALPSATVAAASMRVSLPSIIKPLPEFWEALDERTRRAVLAVRFAQLAEHLPCTSCQTLLAAAAPAVGTNLGVGASGAPPAAPAPGVAPFVLHRLSDGSWISDE
jgi:hypothetical protein